jgi:hypothetical protein
VPNVDWTTQAIEDLQELPPAVAHALLEVGRTSLHPPSRLLEADQNEDYLGTAPNGISLYFRRGVTREEGTRLMDLEKEASTKDASEANDEDDTARHWNDFLLYRERTLKEIIRHNGRGLVVLRILHTSDFGAWVKDMFNLP